VKLHPSFSQVSQFRKLSQLLVKKTTYVWTYSAATNETDEKTSRDKFITCVFLAGVDTKKYGRFKTELNNAYVAGQNNYPKTVESAVAMLSHYMNDKGGHMTDEDKGQTDQKSFMQKHKKVTC
jgi:hypothetical protein